VGIGGASPAFAPILGLIMLAPRGGKGLVRSGPPIEGFLRLGGDPLIDLSFPSGPVPIGPFEGLRILESVPGSDGRLKDDGSWLALRIGNV
jgi:hypothetical protein